MSSETDNQTPDQTAPGTGTPPLGTGEQTDWRAKADEWKNRFTGLQGTYTREKAKLDEVSAKVFDLTAKVEALTGEREALALDLEKYKGQATTTATERDGAKAQLDRMNVLLDFPQLLALEKQGLLPAGVGGELRNKLTALSDTLQAQGVVNTQKDGATPPAPNGAKKDRQALMSELRRYQSEGKTAEYDAAYNALIELEGK